MKIRYFFLKNIIFLIITLIAFQLNSKKVFSVEPNEFLQNPALELRARNISKNIRCLVCQNQSIDDSSASLAKDLRAVIREKIKNGYTDEETYKFLTDRYGDFILLKPPLKISTLALWILPFVFLILGSFILFRHNQKSKGTNKI